MYFISQASAMPITHHPPTLGPQTPQKGAPSPAQPSPPPPRTESKDRDSGRESTQSTITSTTSAVSARARLTLRQTAVLARWCRLCAA